MAVFLLLAACSGPSQGTSTAPQTISDAATSTGDAGQITVGDGLLQLTSDLGTVTITPVMHGTATVAWGESVLWIDPWSSGDLTAHPAATILLITDIHGDHLDADAIAAVSQEGTVIVAPQAVADELGDAVQHVLANAASVSIDTLTVTATPMYNLVRGPDEGGLYHDKGRGNGYLLQLGGRTIYFAGDTECTDEMKALSGVDVAFVPMNLPYTMPPDEAAGCVAAFQPEVAVPYHYRGSDLAEFEAALANSEVRVELMEFYPE